MAVIIIVLILIGGAYFVFNKMEKIFHLKIRKIRVANQANLSAENYQ